MIFGVCRVYYDAKGNKYGCGGPAQLVQCGSGLCWGVVLPYGGFPVSEMQNLDPSPKRKRGWRVRAGSKYRHSIAFAEHKINALMVELENWDTILSQLQEMQDRECGTEVIPKDRPPGAPDTYKKAVE